MKGNIVVIIKENLEILFRPNSSVIITLWALVEVVVELFRRAGLLAFFALEPDAFRHVFFRLGGGGDALAQAFVPTHGTIGLIDC